MVARSVRLLFQPVVGVQVHFLTGLVEAEGLAVAGIGDVADGLFVHGVVAFFVDEMLLKTFEIKVFIPGFGVIQHCLPH